MNTSRSPATQGKQKRKKMCYILSLSIIGVVFFGDIVSKLKLCKVAFVEVLLSSEGPCYGHVNL